MQRRLLFVLTVLLLCLAVLPTLAQDATAEPTVEVQQGDQTGQVGDDTGAQATQEAGQTGGQVTQVTRIQLAHFAPDAPALIPYVNGQATIQTISYPSVTGLVEFPGAGVTLALVPEGSAQSQAVIGPVTVSSRGWTTIIVAGSAQNGTLAAYLLDQPFGELAPNCARVVLFHGIEGGPAVELTGADGTSIGASLSFPGGAAGQSAGGSAAANNCVTTTGGQAGGAVDAQATDEAGAAATQEAVAVGSGQQIGESGRSLQCRLLSNLGASASRTGGQAGSTDAQATDEAGAAATQEAGAAGDGQVQPSRPIGTTFQNCGFVIDIPAGAANFQPFAGGSQLLDLSGMQFAANTYNFVALIGSADNPQTFTFTVQGPSVNQLLENEEAREGGAGGQTGGAGASGETDQTGGDTGTTDAEATQEAGGSGGG